MKVGILDAEYLTDSVIQKYGCYADAFIRLLSPLQQQMNQTVSFVRYRIFNMEFPQSVDECDLYIITGSQHSSYENIPWIKRLEQLVQQLHSSHKKLIGICFGHQIIAQSLGGSVEKNPKGWELGIATTFLTRTCSWMKPTREFFFILVSHQDHVTKLPANAINFCETKLCSLSGFYVDNHILTFQGHPEFSKDYVKLIIRLQSKNLTKEQRQLAKAYLRQSTDHQLVAQWMINFINT